MVRPHRRVGPASLLGAILLCGAAPGLGQGNVESGPSLAEIVEVADIEALAPSPDGRLIAFQVQRPSIERNSHSIEWYVADIHSGRLIRVASQGRPIYNDGTLETEGPIWSPDSRFIYHRSLVDGVIGVWRSAVDGSGSTLLVGGDADVEKLELSDDGTELVYITGPTRAEIVRAERAEYDDGILVDESVDLNQGLFQGGYVHGRLASQRLVGRWYQRDGLLWRAPRTRHRINLRTLADVGNEPLPPPTVEPMSAARGSGGLSATSVRGDIASVQSGDAARLEVRRRDGTTLICAAVECRNGRIVALAWRPGHDELLFTRQDRHFRQNLYTFSSNSGRVRPLTAGDGQLGGGRSAYLPCALTVEYALCVTAGAVSPPQLERIDFSNGHRTILHDPNSTLRARTPPRVEYLEWRLADGRLATGIMLLPARAAVGRAPLFITYYHCPGYLRGGVGDEYPLAPMVGAGFVVACLNLIPFDQWGDGADRYRAALASVESLVDILDHRGLIDRARIGMGGFSAGSEATMWVAMNSRLLAAAAVASPQYEPSAYWLGAIRGRDNPRVMREFMQAAAPDEDPARWRIISPALNADRITVPLLMQLPEQETRSAIELYARLTNSSTPVEMYAFPDEGHVKIQPRHKLAVYRRNLDWFRFWLQDQVDEDPARAGQYARWQALRLRRGQSAVE